MAKQYVPSKKILEKYADVLVNFALNHGKVSKKEWEKLGYNNSSVHTDIISTSPRTVTAYLPNGKTKVIYKNGQFIL